MSTIFGSIYEDIRFGIANKNKTVENNSSLKYCINISDEIKQEKERNDSEKYFHTTPTTEYK